MKDHSKDNEKQETKEKEVIGYDYEIIERDQKLEYCDGCNGKYLVYTSSDNVISKIYKTNGKLLYEGEYDYDYVYEGLDHSLYILQYDLAIDENVISINRLNDGEIEHLFKVAKENIMFKPILYQDKNDDYYLLGFVGELISNESGEEVVEKTYIVNLDNEIIVSSPEFYQKLNEDVAGMTWEIICRYPPVEEPVVKLPEEPEGHWEIICGYPPIDEPVGEWICEYPPADGVDTQLLGQEVCAWNTDGADSVVEYVQPVESEELPVLVAVQ